MKSNLRKTTKKGLAVVSAIVGLSALFAACSSSDEKGVAGGVSEDAGFVADVAGVAQKGPFVKGSAVTVRGVDCKTLEFTDQIFESTVESDKGDFTLDSIALDSSCAVIEVTGKYLNEVTGKKTDDEVTLRVLTNLKDRENVNVNLLTSLAYERVMYLVKEKNKTLAKAKTQAESEVLAAFDIKEEIDEFENLNIFESGALLAVSVMMQGDADAAALAKRLDKFDDSFAESGEWKDSETKKAIAEWTAEAAASGELETIRKNIEDMGYAGEVPAFEKYVPVVEPADSTEESSSSAVEESSSSDVIASSGSESGIDSTKQSSSSAEQDARDSTVTSSSSEEVNADTTSSSSVVPPVSSSSRDSLETLISSSSSIPDSLDSLLSSSSVVPDSDRTLSSSSFDPVVTLPGCKTDTTDTCEYGRIVDERDGQIYKTVKIGEQWWMAENLNYEMDSSYCYNDTTIYCDKYGRLYSWAAAMNACPADWRLPSKDDYHTLTDSMGGSWDAGDLLKSTTGWENGYNGKDSYSFNALPAGYKNSLGRYVDEGHITYFWTSSSLNGKEAYNIHTSTAGEALIVNEHMTAGNSVRCVKN